MQSVQSLEDDDSSPAMPTELETACKRFWRYAGGFLNINSIGPEDHTLPVPYVKLKDIVAFWMGNVELARTIHEVNAIHTLPYLRLLDCSKEDLIADT